MQKIFDDILHKQVKCYVNDLLVKSKQKKEHLKDFPFVFKRLRKYQLKINLSNVYLALVLESFLGLLYDTVIS